jgi:hypothetical protein
MLSVFGAGTARKKDAVRLRRKVQKRKNKSEKQMATPPPCFVSVAFKGLSYAASSSESTFRGALVDVDDVDSKELACADVGKPQIGLHVLLIKELGRKAPRKQKTPAKGWRKGKNT